MMSYLAPSYLRALAAKDPEAYTKLITTHVPLGYHPKSQDVLFLRDQDRFAGMYVIGKTGSGKSGFLENLIHADSLTGKAIIVLDPHGDLVDNVLAALPPARLPQTYVISLLDEGWPFGLNLFAAGRLETAADMETAINRIIHVFEVLWPEVKSQQHLPNYVRAATVTLLANPGTTLVDMLTLLESKQYRDQLLQRVTSQRVLNFWHEHDELGKAGGTRIQSLTSRLNALFMGRDLVTNIVGQHRTTINFRRSIERGEILLIKMPMKNMEQTARLISTLIMVGVYSAVYSFADTPEKYRPDLSLYADEFQNYMSEDFASLFTEARKYGVKLTVAHQTRDQLSDFLNGPTMNVRTTVCFQTIPEDAAKLAHLFPIKSVKVKPEHIAPNPTEYLIHHSSPIPVVKTLVDVYLQPLDRYRRGHRIEISDGGFDMKGSLLNFSNVMLGGEAKHENIKLDDPVLDLDHLLREVMRTGDWTLPIPGRLAMSFSNSGRGFFAAARDHRQGRELQADFVWPNYLAVIDEDGGSHWLRPPGSGYEQFLHFCFHLRRTMFHLAKQPLGKVESPSTAEVAKLLSSLVPRSAWVKSAQIMGTIYTHQTPQKAEGSAFRERYSYVQSQTREKYCRPRAEVEKMLEPGNRPHGEDVQATQMVPAVPAAQIRQAPVSRYEEVETT